MEYGGARYSLRSGRTVPRSPAKKRRSTCQSEAPEIGELVVVGSEAKRSATCQSEAPEIGELVVGSEAKRSATCQSEAPEIIGERVVVGSEAKRSATCQGEAPEIIGECVVVGSKAKRSATCQSEAPEIIGECVVVGSEAKRSATCQSEAPEIIGERVVVGSEAKRSATCQSEAPEIIGECVVVGSEANRSATCQSDAPEIIGERVVVGSEAKRSATCQSEAPEIIGERIVVGSEAKRSATCQSEAPKIIGALVVVGYNGVLPGGNRGRMRSKYVIERRSRADASACWSCLYYMVPFKDFSDDVGDLPDQDTNSKQLEAPSTSSQDENFFTCTVCNRTLPMRESMDIFQVGSSPSTENDCVVTGIARERNRGIEALKSELLLFACRICVSRESPNFTLLFAGGVDDTGKEYYGVHSRSLRGPDKPDNLVNVLTENCVLVLHTRGSFYGGEATPGVWNEVSANGTVYTLRNVRDAHKTGEQIRETGLENQLHDGSLIDLCGVTLLWRTAEALKVSPTKQTIESLVADLNAQRPQCPVGLNTLRFSEAEAAGGGEGDGAQRQPYVYVGCGHVVGGHGRGHYGAHVCPVCVGESTAVELRPGLEPAFYVDSERLTHAFDPCGHMTTEKTAKYWSKVSVRSTHPAVFESVCPFCAEALHEPGYVRLIFQYNLD